jgi:hypothetical protein
MRVCVCVCCISNCGSDVTHIWYTCLPIYANDWMLRTSNYWRPGSVAYGLFIGHSLNSGSPPNSSVPLPLFMPLQPSSSVPLPLFMPLQPNSSVPLPLFMPLQPNSSLPLPLFMPRQPSSSVPLPLFMPLQPNSCSPATLYATSAQQFCSLPLFMPIHPRSSLPLPLFMSLQPNSSVPLPLFMPIHPSSYAKAAYVFRPSDLPRRNDGHLPLIILTFSLRLLQ